MRVAILLDNNLTIDRRAVVEVETLLKLPVELTLFCNKEVGKPEEETINGLKIFRWFDSGIYNIKQPGLKKHFAEKIGAHNFDVFHCHDRSMLWIGRIIKEDNPKAILIYESRELFHEWPLHVSSESLSIRVKSWLVRKYDIYKEKQNAAHIDYLVTVNDSLATILKKYFGLKSDVVVTRNMGQLVEFNERSKTLRKKYNLADNDRIIVYIGAHIYRHSLHMEAAMQQFGNKPGIALIVIAGDDSHSQWFKNFVQENEYRNIFFHPLIPINDITPYLSGCDVGIVTAWNKKDLSYWLALDNKIFSYIHAEIPLLASAQPEYQKIVDGYEVGVCINPDEPDAFIKGFNKINENYSSFLPKLKLAKQELNWAVEELRLIGLYNNIRQRLSQKTNDKSPQVSIIK